MKTAKRIKKRQKRKSKVLKVILLIALISLFAYFLLNSEIFNIKIIKVIGNDKLEKEEIIRVSEIHKGENIFKINTNDAKDSIEKLAYTKSAKIRRDFPNTIIINLLERREEILVQNISTYLVADSEGYILNQRDSIDDELPLIKGLKVKNFSIGTNIFEEFDSEEIQEFIYIGNNIGLFKNTVQIDMETIDNINIKLYNGLDIAFGSIDNVKYKLSVLDNILKDASKKEIKYKRIIMDKGRHPILVLEE